MKARSIFALALISGTLAGCGDDPPPAQPPPPPGPPPPEAPATPPEADGGAAASDASTDAQPDVQPPSKTLTDAVPHLARARKLASDGEHASAVEAYRQARDALPNEAFLRVELAEACLVAGDRGCAGIEGRQAIELGGDDALLKARAYFVVGKAAEDTGDGNGAREGYSQSLKLRAFGEAAARLPGPTAEAGAGSAMECSQTRPEDDPSTAAASSHAVARGRTLCPVPERPHEERVQGDQTVRYDFFAALERHPGAANLLGAETGHGARGSFGLVLVRTELGRPVPLVVNADSARERGDEIVTEITGQVSRLTLGPSRPGVELEVTQRGYRRQGSDEGSPLLRFERTDLFIVGARGPRPFLVTHQVTHESGHVAESNCLRGMTSHPLERRGTIWLEDLTLSGVPEICRQTLEQRRAPEWQGESEGLRRVDSSCVGWVASELREIRGPVPSIQLDAMQRERSRQHVLEVSRVPVQLRNSFREHLDRYVILTARSMELTRAGLRGIAIAANESSARILAVSASDTVHVIEAGELGAWTDLEAEISLPDSDLITIVATERGALAPGIAGRTWTYALAVGPGQVPLLALRHESGAVQALDVEPCPSVTTSERAQEPRDGTTLISFTPTRLMGPGSYATGSTEQALCQRLEVLGAADTAEPAPDAGPHVSPEARCPLGTEQLPPVRYSLGLTRRFALVP